jgi:hypothetical protein
MQHSISFRVHVSKALGTHQLLALLAKHCRPDGTTLIAHWNHIDFRSCVISPIPIEVALPKALDAEIVQAIIACKSCRVVATFFASLLGLYDIAIRNIHKHRFVCQAITSAMHILKAFEAKIIFTIGAKYLRAFRRACGAKTATSCCESGMVFSWSLTTFVQGVVTSLAERHEALIALQSRLHDSTRLTRNLQIAEGLMEQQVWLREEKPVHGRLRA